MIQQLLRNLNATSLSDNPTKPIQSRSQNSSKIGTDLN